VNIISVLAFLSRHIFLTPATAIFFDKEYILIASRYQIHLVSATTQYQMVLLIHTTKKKNYIKEKVSLRYSSPSRNSTSTTNLNFRISKPYIRYSLYHQRNSTSTTAIGSAYIPLQPLPVPYSTLANRERCDTRAPNRRGRSLILVLSFYFPMPPNLKASMSSLYMWTVCNSSVACS
jgi:hypothetical protein